MPTPTGMTPNDLIMLALKQAGVVGVGQTPLAEDMNDSFALLNMMMGQWNRRRWLIFHEVDLPFGCNGQAHYTIGPGGDIAYPYRPDRLEGCFLRYVEAGVSGGLRDENADFGADFGPNQPEDPDATSGIDYPLRLIQSREDWSNIALKSLGEPSGFGGGAAPNGFPRAVFYDAAYPLGKVYVWPVATAPFEIHLLIKEELQQLPDLVTAINLPNEYREALLYNLALRLADHYQRQLPATTAALAKAALNTIRNANAQVPLLDMPDAIKARAAPFGGYLGFLNGFST